MNRKIVVGLDETEGSRAALRWAIDYARMSGAEVVAVNVFEAPSYFVNPYDGSVPVMVYSTLRDDARGKFETDWCAPLAAAGVPYRAVLADGRPCDALLAVAERENAELIVTGRRGLSTLGELVLGSVSQGLVHHSTRPVVLVPPGKVAA